MSRPVNLDEYGWQVIEQLIGAPSLPEAVAVVETASSTLEQAGVDRAVRQSFWQRVYDELARRQGAEGFGTLAVASTALTGATLIDGLKNVAEELKRLLR